MMISEMASQPWETTFIHVPGMEALRADTAVWTQKATVMFCPMSMLSTATVAEEELSGYMLVKESGHCGERGALLTTEVADAASCS
jgi:hypothetical protein